MRSEIKRSLKNIIIRSNTASREIGITSDEELIKRHYQNLGQLRNTLYNIELFYGNVFVPESIADLLDFLAEYQESFIKLDNLRLKNKENGET